MPRERRPNMRWHRPVGCNDGLHRMYMREPWPLSTSSHTGSSSTTSSASSSSATDATTTSSSESSKSSSESSSTQSESSTSTSRETRRLKQADQVCLRTQLRDRLHQPVALEGKPTLSDSARDTRTPTGSISPRALALPKQIQLLRKLRRTRTLSSLSFLRPSHLPYQQLAQPH